MQTSNRYFADFTVAEDRTAEAVAFLASQLRWEGRLAELRRPRPARRRALAGTARRPAA